METLIMVAGMAVAMLDERDQYLPLNGECRGLNW